jgi:hypothetical protein
MEIPRHGQEAPARRRRAVPRVLVFTDPHGLAHATKDSAGQTWDLSTQMFTALITFLHAL